MWEIVGGGGGGGGGGGEKRGGEWRIKNEREESGYDRVQSTRL